MSNSNKNWVIVTGGSGAIGSGVVSYFADLNRPVLSLDQKPYGGVNAEMITDRTVNLTVTSDIDKALSESIPLTDKIGLLVNAVGQIWNEPTMSLSGAALRPHDPENWRRVIELNLTAPFFVASRVAVRMARGGGGLIVNISSISSQGNAGQPAYSAAKAGIEGLTRAMAVELGPLGIRVNAIAPGFIDVASTHAALSEEQLSRLTARTPVRKLGDLSDILKAIEFLAEAPFITGAVIDINGGLRL
jgi:3-oxoacyl-[acyl-carrier protein] reductase